MVIIHEHHADATGNRVNSQHRGGILKSAAAFVMKNVHAIRQTHCEIGLAVVIVIARGAAEARTLCIDARVFCRDGGETSIAKIAE